MRAGSLRKGNPYRYCHYSTITANARALRNSFDPTGPWTVITLQRIDPLIATGSTIKNVIYFEGPSGALAGVISTALDPMLVGMRRGGGSGWTLLSTGFDSKTDPAPTYILYSHDGANNFTFGCLNPTIAHNLTTQACPSWDTFTAYVQGIVYSGYPHAGCHGPQAIWSRVLSVDDRALAISKMWDLDFYFRSDTAFCGYYKYDTITPLTGSLLCLNKAPYPVLGDMLYTVSTNSKWRFSPLERP